MPTELAGDIWKPFLGAVDQITFKPLGRLVPWKMSRTTLDIDEDKVDTPNNAVPRFRTQIGAKEGGTGSIENASFDLAFNIFGVNPFRGDPPLLLLRQSMFFRAMFVPCSAVVAAGAQGGFIGVPIRGAGSEIPVGLPAGTLTGGVTYATELAYIMLALKVTRIHHEARAEAGQPFSFDFEICYPFKMPGESISLITGYGFADAINDNVVGTTGNGGFW
jgi:hypothetical protein